MSKINFGMAWGLNGDVRANSESRNAPNHRLERHKTYLTNLFTNQFLFSCKDMELVELQNMLSIILRKGSCAIIRRCEVTRVNNNRVEIYSTKLYAVDYTIQKMNSRLQQPIAISVQWDSNELKDNLKLVYDKSKGDSFVIINSNIDCNPFNTTFSEIIADFAQDLFNIDMAIHQNLQRLQVPTVITYKRKGKNMIGLFTEAIRRTGVVSGIEENWISDKNPKVFVDVPRDYNVKDLINDRATVLDEYGKLLGINVVERSDATYQAREIQMEDLSFNEFKHTMLYQNLYRGCMEVERVFDVPMSLNSKTK